LFNVFHVNYLKENTIFVAKKKRQHKKKIFFTRFRRSYPSDEGAQNIYYYNNKLLQMMIDIEYVYVPPECGCNFVMFISNKNDRKLRIRNVAR